MAKINTKQTRNYKITIEKYLEDTGQRADLPNLCRAQNQKFKKEDEKLKRRQRWSRQKVQRNTNYQKTGGSVEPHS